MKTSNHDTISVAAAEWAFPMKIKSARGGWCAFILHFSAMCIHALLSSPKMKSNTTAPTVADTNDPMNPCMNQPK